MKKLLLILFLIAIQHSLYSQVIEPGSADKIVAPATLVGTPYDDALLIEHQSTSAPAGKQGPGFTAAPANDACLNAITLTVDAACVNGTTREATTQSGENFGCQGSPSQSVWYKFVANSTNMFVEVNRLATSSNCFLSSAVWSGSCLPNTVLSCEDAASGPTLNIHNLTGLTVGNTYYIQVSYNDAGPCGGGPGSAGADFCILVGKSVICNTCSNTCGPICVFSSQPTTAQVTSFCTKYDLKSKLNTGDSETECYTFTANSTTFNLQMVISTVGCGSGNVTAFSWTLQSSSCGSTLQSGNLSNLNATGLTIGQSYVLCYSWTAACEHDAVYPYIVSNAPLPVEYLDFRGELDVNRVNLEWTTASEINNNYFTVERASINDGKQEFTAIGKVDGAGNTGEPRLYRFTDGSPFGKASSYSGKLYYRLKQTDFDGTSAYSPVISVNSIGKDFIHIMPNPVNDQLYINVNAADRELISIVVFNAFGQQVYASSNAVNAGFNRFNIDVTGFAKGAYFVKIEYKDKVVSDLVIRN